MSEPSSPGKASLTSWWKQFKKNEQPHHHQNQQLASPSSSYSSHHVTLQSPSQSPSKTSPLLLPLSGSPTRPFLGYKSRSSHSATTHSTRPLSYVDYNNHSNPISISNNLLSSSQEQLTIRQRRDSFLQQRQQDYIGDSNVFGCRLSESIKVAEAKIYISSDNDGLIRYGRIPRVVALCGSYLKKNALEVEGIFRVAGSTKRIKQLQLIFSNPPDYGSKIDWDGFTVHDAASLFRRFLGSLPEPLIPLELYESFREPLRSRPLIVKYLKDKEKKMIGSTTSTSATTSADIIPTNEKSDVLLTPMSDEEKALKKKQKKDKLRKERKEALKEYANLFDELPELQRQLLFYILDLLAIFNSHYEKNLMPAKNLAAIFQPSILSHSNHDMSPEEYALSSIVIEFMIEYSYKILPAAQAATDAKANAAELLSNNDYLPTSTTATTAPVVATAVNTTATITPSTDSASPLPPKSSYISRKHSKSLSSVQSPSDMLSVKTSKNLNKQNGQNDDIDSNVDDTDDDFVVLKSIESVLKDTEAGNDSSTVNVEVRPNQQQNETPAIKIEYQQQLSESPKLNGNSGVLPALSKQSNSFDSPSLKLESVDSNLSRISSGGNTHLNSISLADAAKPVPTWIPITTVEPPANTTAESVDDDREVKSQNGQHQNQQQQISSISSALAGSTGANNNVLSVGGDERESRWDDVDSNDSKSNKDDKKSSGKWFRKLRSRSSSKNRK